MGKPLFQRIGMAVDDVVQASVTPRLRRLLGVGREHFVAAGDASAPRFDTPPADTDLRTDAWGVDLSPLYRDVPRDDDGNPLAIPCIAEFGESVPVAGVRARQRGKYLRAIRLVEPRDGSGAPTRRELDAPLTPDEWGTMTGIVGTPSDGMVPQVEHQAKLAPYQARGLSIMHGELEKFCREEPAAKNALAKTVNRCVQAATHFAVPQIAHRIAANDATLVDVDLLQRQAERVNIELFGNPNLNATKMLREQIYWSSSVGFALHEFALDVSAAKQTLRLGERVLQGVEPREPRSVQRWIERGNHLVGFQQDGSGAPMGGSSMAVVDIRKCVYSTNDAYGNNWEGTGDPRSAWFSSTAKRQYQVSGLVHRRRFGPGFPLFELGADAKATEKTMASIHDAAKRFYYAKQAYMALPPQVTMKILQLQPEAAVVEILAYFDQQIRESFGVMHEGLGHGESGSYALDNNRTQEYLMVLRGKAMQVSHGLSRMAKAIIDAIWGPQPIYPVLQWDGILDRSDAEVRENWASYAALRGVMDTDRLNVLGERLGIPPEPVEEDSEEDSSETDSPAPSMPGDDAEDDDADATVEDTQAESRAHVGCGHDHRRGKKANATVIGRDGLEWRTWRQLRPSERADDGRAHVALRSLSDSMDRSRQSMADDVAELARAHRDEFLSLADPYLNTGDIVGVAGVDVDYAGRYTDALRTQLTRHAELVSDDMLDEIASIIGSSWVPDPQFNLNGKGLADQIEAEALAAGRQLSNWVNDQLRSAAKSVANGANRSTVSKWVPNEGVLLRTSSEAVSRVTSEAREETVAVAGPTVLDCEYSALLDSETCGDVGDDRGTGAYGGTTCAGLDSAQTKFGSARYEEIKPPNTGCLSNLNLTRGNACRCLMIYMLAVTESSSRFRIVDLADVAARARTVRAVFARDPELLAA